MIITLCRTAWARRNGGPFFLKTRSLLLALSLFVPAAASAAPLSISMIAKGSPRDFWQAVMRGAQMAARDYAVTVTFDGPDDGSADRQVQLLDAALAGKPAALCIAAVDSAAVIPLLKKAAAAKIPVIGFESGVDSPIPVTTAATDNLAAAALAADKMAALIGGSGKVGLILSDDASRTAVGRRDGFLRAMEKFHSRVDVLPPQYGGADVVKSTEAAKEMILANPDIRGIVAGDEASAAGVVDAVQSLDLAGKVVVIGYDSGKAQLDAIRSGIMAGAVTQDPVRIGYLAVEAAVRAVTGKRVARAIDTGFHWYDQANIDDPSIEAILFQ